MQTNTEIGNTGNVRVTVVDADRIEAITVLAQMGLELAKALAANPRVDFYNCPIKLEVTGKKAVGVAVEVKGRVDVEYDDGGSE